MKGHIELLDPSKYSDWLAPHSIIAESNGESIFDDDVFSMLQNKKVLDVGSDYDEYAIQYSSVAKNYWVHFVGLIV